MWKWRQRRDTFLVMLGASSLVLVILLINFYAVPSNVYLRKKMLQLNLEPLELTFIEGLLLIISGILSLLGRGRINWFTVKTVVILYMRKVLYGDEMSEISKIFRRDLWQPIPSTRIGLSLVLAGLILLGIFFLTMPH